MRTISIDIIILLLLLVFTSLKVNTHENNSSSLNSEENLLYSVYYNYSNFWVNVGNFELITKTINYNGELCYNFQSKSNTNDNWKWVYEVSSTYDVISSIDSLKPVKYHQSTKYGSHHSSYTYNFYNDSILINSSVDGKKGLDKLENEVSVYDALTAVQYARTFDFSTLSAGDSLYMNVLHGNEFLDQKILFDGITELKSADGKVNECYKFSSVIRNNDIISDSQPAEVWVSTNKSRTPLKIIVKIAVGSVELVLVD